MSAKVNRQWRLRARPAGLIKESDFEWREEPVAEPAPGKVLVRNVYLSLDPANRGWLNEGDTYVPAVPLGEVMRGLAIGVVEESRDRGFQPGDLCSGMLGWQDYAVADASTLSRVRMDQSLPLTAQFGLMGHIGMTAYFGLLDIGKPKAGETLVVTGAAGAVGSLVGQLFD